MDDDADKLLALIAKLLDRELQPIHNEILELHVKSSVQRHMIEQLYALDYLDKPELFRELMDRMSDHVKQPPTKVGPTSPELVEEQIVRSKVYFDRIRDSVLLRIRQGIRP